MSGIDNASWYANDAMRRSLLFRVGDVLEKKNVPMSRSLQAAISAILLAIADFPAPADP